MPMGIVSDAEFDKEKKNSTPTREVLNPTSDTIPIMGETVKSSDGIIKDISRGRPHGAVEVPNALRQIIGEESAIHGRQSALDLAKQFGVSPSSVSAYNNGSTSTASYNEQPNLDFINKGKDRVARKAMNKLQLALKAMTPEKLEGTKAVELAAIAKSMSGVIKDMEPDKPKSDLPANGPTFVLYAPQYRDERSYETIDAKE